MVAIAAGQTWTQINTTISGSPSPSTFNWGADTFRADTDLVRRAGDIHIGAGTVESVGAGSATIISGAIVIANTGWTASGGMWWKAGITQRSTAADETLSNHWLANSGWNGGTGDTNGWKFPEVLIIEKTYVPRVNQQAAVSGSTTDPNWGYTFAQGTFYFDEGADTLWIGVDPTGLTIELGVENRLCSTTSTVTFTDMTVEGFATGIQESPIARGISGQILTRMEFRFNHSYGWGVSNGTIATDVISHHNGHMGYGGSSAHNHVLTRCDDWENNLGMANPEWEAGGSKIAISSGGAKNDCHSYNNLGYGSWYDIRNINNVETRGCSNGNVYTGYSAEIGYKHDYLHCVGRGNGWGDLRPSWLWYTQFLNQICQDVTYTECYAEHAQTNPFTGGTEFSDGFGAVGQSRGLDPSGNPYTYDRQTVTRCIDDFVNKNAGHVGAIRDAGPEPTTHNWNNNLWYGLATLGTTYTAWATGSGPYENLAGWASETYVSNQTVRAGRAPRTMSLSSSANLTQDSIRAGGLVFTCELDIIEAGFPDWLTDWFHGNLGDDSALFREDLMGDLLDGLTGTGGGANEWNTYVRPLLAHGQVSRVDDHTFTLTLPAAASYTALGETLSWTIPANNMVSRQTLAATQTLSVSTVAGQVSVLDAFAQAGATYSPSAGANRLVVYAPAHEHLDGTISMTSVTLGGQSMTKKVGFSATSGASNRAELWYLNEAGIAAMVGTTLTPTWSATPSSSDEAIIGTLQNVDQSIPTGGSQTGTAFTATSVTVGLAEDVQAGDLYVYVVSHGTSALAWSAASGYTAVEVTGVGQRLAVGYKSITATDTEQPSVPVIGTANRLVGVAMEINPAAVTGVTGTAAVTNLIPTVAAVGSTGVNGAAVITNLIPVVAAVGLVAEITVVTGVAVVTNLLPVVAAAGQVLGLDYSYGTPSTSDPQYTFATLAVLGNGFSNGFDSGFDTAGGLLDYSYGPSSTAASAYTYER